MPKVIATGAGWFNLKYFIMAEYVELPSGRRKLRVTMDVTDEHQTRDLDTPDSDKFVARLNAMDAESAEKLGLVAGPSGGKRAERFKDRKAAEAGETGDESGPGETNPPPHSRPVKAPRPR